MSDSCEDDTNNIHPKKALIYLPFSEYCTDHEDLFLHEDEKLVKPGDKFSTLTDFVQYLNENAKRWCFYYKCLDSHKPNTESETYTYNCVYLKNKEKYIKKGLRKRSNNMKTDCPCKIKLRHLPNENELTVVYVCNHHDHELSLAEFYKLQHGRRLPPYVKEEIKDLLYLKVDVKKIRAYVEMETGFKMGRPFFYTLDKDMKSNNEERPITAKRLALLKEKIAVVEEMCVAQDDEDEKDESYLQDHVDDTETPTKPKQRRSLQNAERARGTPPLVKRRSKKNNEVTSSDDSKRTKKIQPPKNALNNEASQSVKNLQDSVKCEIQSNPWVSDQCVPVLPHRTTAESEYEEAMHIQTVENLNEDAHSEAQNEMGYFIIENYDPDDSQSQEMIRNEINKIINDVQVAETEQNDNIAYETVVTDGIETQNEVQEFVDHEQIMQEGDEIQLNDSENHANDQSEVLIDLNSTQDINEVENHVEYIAEDIVGNNNEVEYLEEVNEGNNKQGVAVQMANETANEDTSTQTLLPVFDVYMKDGNVTGFVVNDSMVSGLKDGVEKETQTSEELILGDAQETENDDFDIEIIRDLSNSKTGNIFTQHEYIHKYNIDKYMVQPHFPKYIETLAKEMSLNVLEMFTNIYNETAILKMTTTQKGKEGNTRIWYITDDPRAKKRRKPEAEANRQKLGRNLQSVFILREKIRRLKRRNKELMSQNKQLEDVALRLVEMT